MIAIIAVLFLVVTMTSPNTGSYFIGRELCQSFSTVRWFCQLFGTAPSSMDMLGRSPFSPKNDMKKIVSHLVQLSWTVAIYFCHLYCAYQTITETMRRHLPFFTQLLYNCELIITTISMTMIFIGCRYHSAQYHIVTDKIVEVLVGFELFGENNMLQKVQQRLNAVIVFATVLFMISVGCDFHTRPTFWKTLISVGSYILPHWITVMAMIQYTYVVSVIHQITKHSNRVLKRQVEIQHTVSEKNVFDTIDFLQQKILLINHLMYDVNKVFGWLFLNTILSVIIVSSVQFLEGYQFSYRKTVSIRDITYFIYTIFWIVLQLGHLMLFLYPNHLVKYEMKKIALNLCELDRPELFEIVEKFSRQFLLHDGQYLACGIVELDLKLLTSIFGALTTYLVLLIQYDTGDYRSQFG
ncbi:AAEL017169-PA, partial [Aedes aegypti]